MTLDKLFKVDLTSKVFLKLFGEIVGIVFNLGLICGSLISTVAPLITQETGDTPKAGVTATQLLSK